MAYHTKWQYKMWINTPTVLLLHAFPASSEMWEPQLTLMKEMNLPVIAPDYPGFGKSSIPEKEMDIDDYAHAIYDILRETDISEVIIVGLSMGGYVALALYRLYPQIFKGLVLADTKISADNLEVKKKRMDMIQSLINQKSLNPVFENHLDLFFSPESRMQKPELIEKMYKIFNTASVNGVKEAQRAMANRLDSTELVKKMNFPVLVITGEKDKLTTVSATEQMVKYFPDAELKIIPDAAHLSNLENPIEFNKTLGNYLKRII